MREYRGGSGAGSVAVTYLSVGGTDISVSLGKACEGLECRSASMVLRTYVADETVRDAGEYRDMIRSAKGSDIMIVNFHGDPSGYRRYDDLHSEIVGHGINTFVICNVAESMAETRPLFLSGDDAYSSILAYLRLGGPENRDALIRYIMHLYGDPTFPFPEPRRERMQGIWHPDYPDLDLEGCLARLDPSKPVVGVLIPQASWVNGRLESHTLLIRDIESLGAVTLPVFLSAAPDSVSGSDGGEKVIREYMMDSEGKSRVDALVLAGFGFSFLTLCSPGDGTGGRSTVFADLDVPVLGAIGIFRPREEWAVDGIGMEGGELAISVALPELDGQLTTVPFTFNDRASDGSEVTGYDDERIMMTARMAVRWARVSHVPVSERKVSILFNGGTLSNASIGAAGGLDSFESACAILRRMADAGYTIDRVPENGREIIDEMLAALTNNLEWVQDGEVEVRAADLIDNGTYR